MAGGRDRDAGWELHRGDCLEAMRAMPDASFDSVVTDPPYGIGLMEQHWDRGVPPVAVWREALRVLKPGGWLAAFGAARTYHRLASAVEDAGFEIRDQVMWLYGKSMPKGRKLTGRWEGLAVSLKPAHEPVVLARRPPEGSVERNLEAHGTGALRVGDCRVPHVTVAGGNLALNPHLRASINGGNGGRILTTETERRVVVPHADGRWPANVVLADDPEVLGAFPGGAASPARFFYCAKAGAADRCGSAHTCVKPVALMRWLVRLVTPPGGRVLDPFAGSGTTGQAAVEEGLVPVLVEREAEYCADIERRMALCLAAREP